MFFGCLDVTFQPSVTSQRDHNDNQMRSPTRIRNLALRTRVLGVMTPHKKNLMCLYALLNGQGRLSVLCSRQCTESRVKKDQQGFAVTNSIEFKMTSTHMCSRNKVAESTDSFGKGNKVGRLCHRCGLSSSARLALGNCDEYDERFLHASGVTDDAVVEVLAMSLENAPHRCRAMVARTETKGIENTG